MILAEERGEKLGALTAYSSKPAVHFGGNKRIIDFTVSNCINSGIDTIGILCEYNTTELQKYINQSYNNEDLYLLPAYLTGDRYDGTADAIYKNMKFIERFDPEYVLILPGDHIYKMDYKKMIEGHEESGADVTVAVRRILTKKSSDYGFFEMDEDGNIQNFQKKPFHSDLERASTGAYVFKWSALRENLLLDAEREGSWHDFCDDILPHMLNTKQAVNVYESNGYWREVDTIESLWEANMEVLDLKSVRTRLLSPGY
jgi:glucose-1-phosphate adenylyltransferase